MTAVPPPRPKPRRRGLPRWATLLIVAVLVAGLGVGAWKLWPRKAEEPYRTAAVEQGDLTRSVSASGELEALDTVIVGSQLSGQVKEVLVDFNDPVRRGQVMAVLDPQTYVSRVNQAQADVAAAGATLGQQRANLVQAQAQLDLAKAEYSRQKFLFDKGITAQASLDTALAQQRTAEAAVQVARAQIGAQAARVGQSRASLGSNQVDLGRTRIIAPIDGVVINRNIEPGQTVAASLQAPELFTIAGDLSRLQVNLSVDEADVGQLQEGQTLRFTVDAFPDQTFRGVITQVRQQPTKTENVVAYTVIAEAENPRRQLLPGMTANADVLIEERRGVLKVPTAALRFQPVTPDQQRPQGGGLMGPAGPQQKGGGGGGQGGGGGGGGQRGGGMNRMIEQLDLDAAQRRKVEPILAEMRSKMQAAAGGDGDARRAAMRAAREEMRAKLDPILRPDQKAKLAALQAQMGGGRGGGQRGLLYVLRDGKPFPIAVGVGGTDGSSTEIRTTELKAGDQVIIGGGPRAAAQLRGGPLGGGGGGGATRRL